MSNLHFSLRGASWWSLCNPTWILLLHTFSLSITIPSCSTKNRKQLDTLHAPGPRTMGLPIPNQQIDKLCHGVADLEASAPLPSWKCAYVRGKFTLKININNQTQQIFTNTKKKRGKKTKGRKKKKTSLCFPAKISLRHSRHSALRGTQHLVSSQHSSAPLSTIHGPCTPCTLPSASLCNCNFYHSSHD